MSPDLCGDGELRDDDGHWVGVFGQLPGAGQLHYLLVRVGGIRRRRFGVPKALDQGLNLVEVSLLPEQRRLFEITGKSEFRRAQKVQDVAEKTRKRIIPVESDRKNEGQCGGGYKLQENGTAIKAAGSPIHLNQPQVKRHSLVPTH